MYKKCGGTSSLAAARAVFDQMPKKDVVPWSCIIAAYVQSGHCREAINLFQRMDVEPNEMVIVSTLAACSGNLALGMAIHARIFFPDLRKSVFVGTALLNMYAKCGAIEQARAVFDQLTHKDHLDQGRKIHDAVIDLGLHSDITIQNALVSMYAKGGSAEEALLVFQRMEDRNRVSWNSMIAAFATSAKSCTAMCLFHGMNLEGIKPDDVSFLGVLSACSSTGCLRSCKRIHSQLELAAVHSPPDLSVENSLVTAYARSRGR
ncbi:pentatricopeptide repeat-containing protein At2g34400-like [Selaginella moellendorffii]|uniref:pentatricopeptide repeat-containing protein At2g34400-like n=1 Tax=Selaginella moellendorffii TaxID=88036 RepID=UPI000D1C2E5E|nr:pentatricopeptide repeat-containing protein At2g34400-like [Selaginella moellendorffii]|eukprot:XP_024542291.1 pentatricopeptide repeat-containing protein At2g34400-like [Selaginella moellendorffii]